MSMTRRDFGKFALAGLPASALFRSHAALGAALFQKPNSKWAGVQVGMNVPYNFGEGNYVSGEEILKRCLQLNTSAVELRRRPVELFMGSPEALEQAATAAAAAVARRPRPNSRPRKKRRPTIC